MSHLQGDVIILFTPHVPGAPLHEPIFVDLFIHNRLGEEIQFDLGHNRKGNLDFAITKPDGSILRAPRLSEEGTGRIGRIVLGPDESYDQRLVLNEWYDFAEPGEYKIAGSLPNPVRTRSGAAIEIRPSGTFSLQIQPRNPERLNQVCQALVKTAVESSDVSEAAEAALALSYVQDPIAVPYLEKGLEEREWVWLYAIPGLARIANKDAIEILFSIMKGEDREAAALARFVLYELKDEIQDRRLSERIERALGTQGDC